MSFKSSVKPLRAAPVARKAVQLARAASCSAQEQAPVQVGKVVAAAALAAALAFGSVDAAHADISGLTPCSESKGFAKRQKNEIKALSKRLSKVNHWTLLVCISSMSKNGFVKANDSDRTAT